MFNEIVRCLNQTVSKVDTPAGNLIFLGLSIFVFGFVWRYLYLAQDRHPKLKKYFDLWFKLALLFSKTNPVKLMFPDIAGKLIMGIGMLIIVIGIVVMFF